MMRDPQGYEYGYVFDKRKGVVRYAWAYTAGHPTCSKGRYSDFAFKGKTVTDYPSGPYVRRERLEVLSVRKNRWTLTDLATGAGQEIRALPRNGKGHGQFRRLMNNLLNNYCPPILARI